MRTFWCIAALAVAASASPATAQMNDTGIPTETQERLRGGPPDIPWGDLIGLLGLFGLLGLRREHADDSYHPASVE